MAPRCWGTRQGSPRRVIARSRRAVCEGGPEGRRDYQTEREGSALAPQPTRAVAETAISITMTFFMVRATLTAMCRGGEPRD